MNRHLNINLSRIFYYLLFLSFGFGIQSCKTSAPVAASKIKPNPKESSSNQPNTKTEKPSNPIVNLPEFYKPLDIEINPSPREFRGVWIATVANIDWPTSPTDLYAKQKEDFIKLLDYYKSLNFNAVIVQVRAAGDAFYPSRYAPWSKFLTGKQGQKPDTTEDPLSWMILESHKRGLEFHAWFNPYRATMNLDTKELSPNHDFVKHPNWMIKYDTKYYYNPGLPEVKAQLVEIIREVVRNYNIDAVHFDDYFYPYKVENVKFDDAASFKKYGKPGQKLDDWRRDNVNQLVKELNASIKAEKPWVQFGISPFGVWRNIDKDPEGSKTRAGQTNYDDLYADVLTWMKNGWIDYLIPQLYWSMDYNLASHRILIDWWSRNHFDTKIYIGNGPYKIRDNADKAWDNPMEISNQVGLSRITPNISGNAYFSAKSLYLKNKDVAELLHKNHYHFAALPPDIIQSPISEDTNQIPVLIPHGEGFAFQFPLAIDPDYRFAIILSAPTIADLQKRMENVSSQMIYLDESNRMLLPILTAIHQKYIALSFVDRYGNESTRKVFEIQRNLKSQSR